MKTYAPPLSLPAQQILVAAAAPHGRFDRLDALRGFAIVWMAAFHFCFDLNYYRFIHQNFYVDPFWTVQRACIVTLFMRASAPARRSLRPSTSRSHGSGDAGRRSPAARCSSRSARG